MNGIISTLKLIAGFLGYSDFAQLAADIELDITKPSEANLEQTARDLGTLISDRVPGVTPERATAFVTFLIAWIAAFEAAPADRGALIETGAAVTIEQLPIALPELNIDPADATAWVQLTTKILTSAKVLK